MGEGPLRRNGSCNDCACSELDRGNPFVLSEALPVIPAKRVEKLTW